jgi:hypothetical protein
MHGGEKKCIQCCGGPMVRQEAMWSSVEEDLFPILMPPIFVFKIQHCAGEWKFHVEVGVKLKY